MTRSENEREALLARLAELPRDVRAPDTLWARIEANVEGGSEGAPERTVDAAEHELTARLARLPRGVPAPANLWPHIRRAVAAGPRAPALETPKRRSGRGAAPRTLGAWQRAAAAIGGLSLVAIVGLGLLRLGTLADDGSSTSTATADLGWLAPERLAMLDSVPSGALLRAALEGIRQNYEMTRAERLAIEAEMQDDLNNENLQALWRHAYATEMSLTSEAERILANYR